MREIKFRAWDKVLNYYHMGNDYISLSWDKEGCIINSELVVEQFTGLTDKNGKEIYEGDIVLHNRYVTHFENSEEGSIDLNIVREGFVTITASKGVCISGTIKKIDMDDDIYEQGKYYGNPNCFKEYSEIVGNIHE